jgi:hypothetical protein
MSALPSRQDDAFFASGGRSGGPRLARAIAQASAILKIDWPS